MRLSRSFSVVERKKNQRLGSLRTKKKHKRLDAICEKAYNRSHGGVRTESNEFNDEGRSACNESELRRSTRVRRAPAVLDASPPPVKKRRRVDKTSGVDSVGRGKRKDGVKSESPCSTSRDVEEEPDSWGSRLRSRAKNVYSSRRSKRKLFGDSNEFNEEVKVKDSELDDREGEELEAGRSTVVKSKRPGRIKASNISGNACQEIEASSEKEHDKEKNEAEVEVDENKNELEGHKEKTEVELLEDDDEEDPLQLNGCESEHDGIDDIATKLVEEEASDVPAGLLSEECIADDNVEQMEHDKQVELPESVKKGENQGDSTQVGEVLTDQVEDGECRDKPLEDQNGVQIDKKDHSSIHMLGKLRVREGRRCGLCGTGTEGKPPKKLVQDGAESDREAYSGSSASEEPNYDTWDGFGDEPGWLGRLLGPINDRYGIAGIWVHQHCAVWSPEVYFAGVGCLKNVRAALCRGRVLKCSRCGRRGATIGCRVDRCPKTYHLPCARANGCIFDHRKFLIACTDHRYLFQPHGSQYFYKIKKLKAKKMKLEMRKLSNDAWRKDLEAEEKWLENCGEDEEFLKRESKRLHRDLLRIAPVYIGGSNSEKNELEFQGWESVAGLQDVVQCMKEVVILPLLYPEFFSNMGITPPRGVLLHGYPGTGKTLVVRALIGSCARGDKRIAYFARKGADCLGKYVGDAERQLRLLFQVAEKSQPSIIFFDEIDGLAPCRTRQQDQTHNSVVSTLLALLDGLKSRGSVVVIGATNRPDAVDPALRRPGRFDREIYFPLPSTEDRAAIISLHTKRWPQPVTGSLLNWIARRTVGFAGADLQALCTQAVIIALRRNCPLQELMTAAEKKSPCSKRPPLPAFAVEERDWLEALSCAPPPSSQRGAGMATNDLVASPLHSHLIPCLLQPLARLLVSLYLDERLLLTPPLCRAGTLIKTVIISALDKKKASTDQWWSHVHNLLQEADVLREIEDSLSHGGILIGDATDSKFDACSDANDDSLNFRGQKLQQLGTRPNLLQNISYASRKKSGFRVLISGSPRAGQRYLASCLLHCFVGNVEIQKVDLATISQEGHGDVMQGITRILMRCASVQSCMIFMPRIDLWAIETHSQVRGEGNDSSLSSPEVSEDTSFVKYSQVAKKENGSCHKVLQISEMAVSQDAYWKPSLIWSSFLEQVESICVSTSLTILATSEVPFPALPLRIRQFFKSKILDFRLSNPSEETIPRFSVQLDGNFNCDMVIQSSALEVSKDLTEQFVQLIHHGTHDHLSSCMTEKSYETLEGEDKLCYSMDPGPVKEHEMTQFPGSSVVTVPCPPNSRPSKGKSSLLLAVSTFGYQILRYPHFAELCWFTSKLKEGPSVDINGPWKGWPFNSCIVRPSNPMEKVSVACSSSSIRGKEKYALVRGLIAVGLSAYRGIYTSPREVSLEVRKVMELLAGEINAKIQAGKDKYQFIRILSQMAYLEDVVNSWAHTLLSLEVDPRAKVPTPKSASLESLENHGRCEDNLPLPQNDGCDVSLKGSHETQMLVASPQRFDLEKGEEDVDLNPGERIVTQGSPLKRDVCHSDPALDATNMSTEEDGITCEACDAENPSNLPCVDGDFGSSRHSNGYPESGSTILRGYGPCLVELGSSKPNSSQEANDLRTVLPTETNILPEDGKPSFNEGRNADTSFLSCNTTTQFKNLGVICSYSCCSECLFNLHALMLKFLTDEFGRKESVCVSTVDDVHDMVASLSANLHAAVRKLFLSESSSDRKPDHDAKSSGYRQKIGPCHCKDSGDKSVMLMECSCHSKSKKGESEIANSSLNTLDGFDLRLICRDGVVSRVDPGENVSFHCKFETLCLCSLIEWIVIAKQPLG